MKCELRGRAISSAIRTMVLALARESGDCASEFVYVTRWGQCPNDRRCFLATVRLAKRKLKSVKATTAAYPTKPDKVLMVASRTYALLSRHSRGLIFPGSVGYLGGLIKCYYRSLQCCRRTVDVVKHLRLIKNLKNFHELLGLVDISH